MSETQVEVSTDDIVELMDNANDIDGDDDNAGFHGMSYEAGIRDALSWVLTGDENPLTGD